MATEIARRKAARAWTQPTTEKMVMIPELAEAFAEILDEIMDQPRLGCATTSQLIDEIQARIAIDGRLEYRTVDN